MSVTPAAGRELATPPPETAHGVSDLDVVAGKGEPDAFGRVHERFSEFLRSRRAPAREDLASLAGAYEFRPGGLAPLFVVVGPQGLSLERTLETEAHVRATVGVDVGTLERLLAGSLQARTAFFRGLVKIRGDLPAFLRLASLFKRS